MVCAAVGDLSTRLRGNTTLTSLSLACNNFGDDGVVALAPGVRDNRSLRELSLASNALTSRAYAAHACDSHRFRVHRASMSIVCRLARWLCRCCPQRADGRLHVHAVLTERRRGCCPAGARGGAFRSTRAARTRGGELLCSRSNSVSVPAPPLQCSRAPAAVFPRPRCSVPAPPLQCSRVAVLTRCRHVP